MNRRGGEKVNIQCKRKKREGRERGGENQKTKLQKKRVLMKENRRRKKCIKTERLRKTEKRLIRWVNKRKK